MLNAMEPVDRNEPPRYQSTRGQASGSPDGASSYKSGVWEGTPYPDSIDRVVLLGP
jgi:hypothetical protein